MSEVKRSSSEENTRERPILSSEREQTNKQTWGVGETTERLGVGKRGVQERTPWGKGVGQKKN